MMFTPWNDPNVKWVCENHPDKEWEIECDCGAGMPEPTPENYQKGYISKDYMKYTHLPNEITTHNPHLNRTNNIIIGIVLGTVIALCTGLYLFAAFIDSVVELV